MLILKNGQTQLTDKILKACLAIFQHFEHERVDVTQVSLPVSLTLIL